MNFKTIKREPGREGFSDVIEEYFSICLQYCAATGLYFNTTWYFCNCESNLGSINIALIEGKENENYAKIQYAGNCKIYDF